MKKHLRLILIVTAGTSLFFTVACKKSSSSVVGNWTLSNVSGSTVSGANSLTVTYANKQLTEVKVKNDTTKTTAVPYTLNLNILSGGAYVFTETYNIGTAVAKTDTFTWLQGGNSLTFGSLNYNGQANANNYLFNNIIGANSATVGTLNSSEMVLTFTDSINFIFGQPTTASYTLTFSN